LLLVEHSNWLYSIKFVFTDPLARKMGVATGLLKFALSTAKSRGARKVFLNVEPSHTKVIDLYEKLGFRVIVKSLELWANLSGFSHQSKQQLSTIDVSKKENTDFLLNICNRCMGKDWLDFFEINKHNLINGFSQDYRRFFLRTTFTSEKDGSSILFFNRPLFNIASAEVFVTSDSNVPSLLDALASLLYNKGIASARLTLFNINDYATVSLLQEKKYYIYHSLSMGLTL
jgi:hypothetical protein